MFNNTKHVEIACRAREIAVYVVEHNATVREAAKHFGMSKSTVHKDLSDRLPDIDAGLAANVRSVLNKNFAERQIRGGNATRLKYKKSLSTL